MNELKYKTQSYEFFMDKTDQLILSAIRGSDGPIVTEIMKLTGLNDWTVRYRLKTLQWAKLVRAQRARQTLRWYLE